MIKPDLKIKIEWFTSNKLTANDNKCEGINFDSRNSNKTVILSKKTAL